MYYNSIVTLLICKKKIMVFSNTVPEDTHPQNTGQEGGTVAVSKAYDWRDDPYELMLLQQKLHKPLQDSASGRKAASSSSGNKNRLGLKAATRY
jgi:hypothetical protein